MLARKYKMLILLTLYLKSSFCQFYFPTTPYPYNNQNYNNNQYYNNQNYNNQYSYNYNQYSPYNNYSYSYSYSGSNPCICVTPGYCNRANGSFYVTTDGSGLIDFRILNSGGFIPSYSQQTYTYPASTGTSISISSQSSCQAGLELCCLNTQYQCGIRFPPVQGTSGSATGQAPYGSYPWFALILQQYTNTYVASGVLIDQRNVLTVAHKVSPYTSNPFSIKVRLGEWTIGGSMPINSIDYNVIRVTTHYGYNSQSLANSIAILRLSPDVQLGLTPTIANVCLSTNQITSGRCWVAGYGQNTVTGGNSVQNIMQHVELPLVDQTTCQNLLRGTRLGGNFMMDTSSFLCAGGISGRDACTGDGGSGLVCNHKGQWYVVGLVAWGIGCGVQNVPGVYMNVTNYISWIQTTTAQA